MRGVVFLGISARKILFLLVLILFSAGASAETLSGNYIISYFQDAPVERTFTLQNGTTAKDFSIDIIGEKIPWSFVTPTKETIKGFCASSQDIVLCIAPSDFSLAANAQREIYFFSKAKTFAKAGDYFVNVLANGASLGTFTITVQQGHVLSIDSANAEQKAGQCEAKTFAVNVSNNGNFDEEATVTVSGIPSEWLSLSEQSFILNKGASKTVNITVQAPCNQEMKTYSFDATASAPKANVTATKKLSYVIENKQGFAISDIEAAMNNVIEACKETATSKTIKITNNGRIADEIELSLKAPEWAKISANKISVEPGASKTITITAQKTSAEEKQYSAELTAKSTKFGNSTTKAMTINIKDCYNVEIKKVSGQEKACLTDKPELQFEITNNRENKISLTISASGANAALDKKSISLESKKSETVKATIDASGESEGKKELQLDVSGNYFSTIQKFNLEFVKCALEIAPEKQTIDVNAIIGTLTRIIVTNKTLTQENIKIAVRGKEWILFNPKEFSLNPGEKKEIFMYISPPFNTENEIMKAEIIARSERFVATKSIDMNVFAGMEIGMADVLVKNVEIREVGSIKEIKTRISLKNDSNVSITVNDINSATFETKYLMRNNSIKPNENSTAELTILLPKGFDENKFSVPLTIITEQGTFNRFVVIDLNPAKPTDQNVAQTVPIGMAFFAQPKNILLIAVIIALIALVAYLSMKKGEDEKTEEKEEETDEEKSGAYSIAEQVKAKTKKKKKTKKH